MRRAHRVKLTVHVVVTAITKTISARLLGRQDGRLLGHPLATMLRGQDCKRLLRVLKFAILFRPLTVGGRGARIGVRGLVRALWAHRGATVNSALLGCSWCVLQVFARTVLVLVILVNERAGRVIIANYGAECGTRLLCTLRRR